MLLVHLLHSEHYQNYVVNGTETFHNLPVYNLFDKKMKMNLDTTRPKASGSSSRFQTGTRQGRDREQTGTIQGKDRASQTRKRQGQDK